MSGCTKLETITMNNVQNIDKKSFYNCSNLTVSIPHTIAKIGEKAFYKVSKVKGDIDMPNCGAMLILGNNLTEVGERAFEKVKNMQGNGVVLTSGDNTKKIYKNIENTFPKGTHLYICNEAYEQISSNNYFRHRIQSISLTEPKPKKELYVNEPLNLNDYGLKVEFTNGTELVTYFKKGIFACNYKNETRFSSTGKKTVKIQLGKTINKKERLVKYEITVKNKPIEIQNIQIKNPPDKTEYMVGDSLNTKGLEVVGIDIYGTEVLLDKEQYTCSPTSLRTPGTKKITVKYKQNEKLKATFYVTVKEPTYETEIVNYPKTEYKVGDKLKLTDLRVKLQYTSGPSNGQILYFDLNDMRTNPVNGTQLNETGTVDVTMTSNNGENLGILEVNVLPKTKTVTKIIISRKPKTNYTVGDSLSTRNLKLKVIYNDGTSSYATSGFTTDPKKGTTLTEANESVKVTYGGKTASYSISVTPKEIVGIQPAGEFNFVYTKGDKLNLEGLKLKVTYNNNDTEIIEEGFTIEPKNGTILNEVGSEIVKIKYNNKETRVILFINERTLIRIASTNLGKSDYIEGENFEAGELFHVVAVYDNNSMEEVFNYTVVDGDNLKLGQKTVTISYEENGKTVTTTTPITVTPKQLEKIEITREPNKTTYIQGQNFDSTGMQVTATYNSGKTAIINNYSVPNGQNLTVGMTSVKIVYTENGVSKEVEQPITVTLKQPINIRVKENVKKVYIVGEKVDKTNMCVEIEYDDGSIEQVTNYEVDTETSLSRADKTRTITYKEGDITLEKEIDVPVLPAEIQEISIKQYPDNVNYVVGQKFFSNGLILLVKYADETEEEITEDFTLDLPDGSVLTKVETKTVKVNYMGQEVKFDINVKENNDIQALTIMDGSIETNYEIGEKLDLRGLVLISEGSNNDIKVIWGNYECEPAEGTELNTKGQQTITIKYAGKSAVLNINVGEHQVEEIEIENLPKTKYVVGQALDLTGLKLKVMYNNGTEEIVETGYTSSIENGTIFNNVENKTIEISYKEKTTSFDIDVVKNKLKN